MLLRCFPVSILRIFPDSIFNILREFVFKLKLKSETRMTANVVKQNPNT